MAESDVLYKIIVSYLLVLFLLLCINFRLEILSKLWRWIILIFHRIFFALLSAQLNAERKDKDSSLRYARNCRIYSNNSSYSKFKDLCLHYSKYLIIKNSQIILIVFSLIFMKNYNYYKQNIISYILYN